MRLKVRKQPIASLAESSVVKTQRLRSGILPLIRHRLRSQPRCTVFDLGPPSSAKHMYLCHRSTRIFWNNTPGSFTRALEDPGEFNERIGSSWIPGTQNSHFDIVLAWNYFDYLDLKDISDLICGLNRHFVRETWFYFLIHHSVSMPQQPPDLDVELDNCLSYSSPHPTRMAPRYAPRVLQDAMPGLRIEKLYLMSNGLQEHLFTSDV